jgi:hypothetical protein
MTGGNSTIAISKDVLLDDYYANLHGAYNSMRQGFVTSGLSQEHLAAALDVDKSLISRRLNGSENLTLKTLSYMGTAMGCRLTVSFVPYAMVGTGNTYTYTPSTVLTGGTVHSSGGGTAAPVVSPANVSKVLERA